METQEHFRHRRKLRLSLAVLMCLTWVLQPLQKTSAEEFTNSVGIKLRLLDAGRFEMGENDLAPGFYKDHSEFQIDDVRPVHPVVLTKPFFLATTEVTVSQFRRFVTETNYKTSAEKNQLGGVGWDPKPPADNPRYVSTFRDNGGFNWKNPGFDQVDEHPVTGVSFADAKAFCAWLSKKENKPYRLPTEAEWEYAARAGTETYFSFGNTYRDTIHRFANIGNVELEQAFPDRVRRQWLVDIERDPADKHVFTAPVGNYQANPWGLFDMYGNVWEWCEDRYLDTAYSQYTRPGHQQIRKRAIDPLIEEQGNIPGDWRVIRGGSWFNAPVQCRSSVRSYFEATDAACFLGFRLAADPPEAVLATARQKFEQTEAARSTIAKLADLVRERRDGRLSAELNQHRQQLNDEFLTALRSLDEPLDLYLDGRGNLTPEQLKALARTPQLKGLLLTGVGPNVTDADFSVLNNHPQLELLQLSGASKLTNALFAHLRNMDRLELLQLDGSAITDEGLKQLPQLKHLKTLRLDGTSCQGLALDHFRNSPLERFSCNKLSDAGAQLLMSFPLIQEFAFAESPLTRRGLANIGRLARLQRIDLSGCRNLQDADFAVLGEAYNLTSVQLGQTAAGDLAVEGLSRLNNLRELRIGSENLSDAGVRKICEIVSLNNVTITPDAIHLTDHGFVDLWRLANLHSLGVSAPQVTGRGLSAIGELQRLNWLSLDGIGICDAALEHVAESPSLQRLSVGDWQRGGPVTLTDSGVLQLAKARKLVHFFLIRKGTQVTENASAELRKLRPELTVDVRNP